SRLLAVFGQRLRILEEHLRHVTRGSLKLRSIFAGARATLDGIEPDSLPTQDIAHIEMVDTLRFPFPDYARPVVGDRVPGVIVALAQGRRTFGRLAFGQHTDERK